MHDKEAEEGAELDERAETEEEAEPGEDETEAESIEEEQEEQLHDGYAFRQGRLKIMRVICSDYKLLLI